jgi:hypothetical protein
MFLCVMGSDHEVKPHGFKSAGSKIPDSGIGVALQCSLTLIELLNKGGKSTLFQCLTQTLHQLLIEVQVMDGIQLRTQHFVTFVQVMQVGTTEIAAGITTANGIQWARIIFKARITQLQHPLTGK